MLVVIVIVAIATAILFPLFSSAKRTGKLSADLQSARQLGTAIDMYCGDADDLMPPAVDDVRYLDGIRNGWDDSIPGLAKTPWRPLAEILYPYVKNTRIFLRTEDRPDNLPGWPTQIPRSEFLYDELSGLRGKALSSMPPTSTLIYGEVSRGTEARVQTPCLTYNMSIKMASYSECDSKTAWVSDF